MINDDNILESLITNILNPESKNIDHDKLETFMLGLVDELEKNGRLLEGDAKKLLSIVCKLWCEKESWQDMYYGLCERYSKHLDKEITEYGRMLGNRHSRVLNPDMEK